MKHKDEILKLRSEGKTYKEIREITKASLSTISFHCGEGQKEKHRKRATKRKVLLHPFHFKIERFTGRKSTLTQRVVSKQSVLRKIQGKIIEFHRTRKTKEHNMLTFSVQDVINKFGENPRCYLTGDYINIYEPDTYQFDHVIPTSKGGENTLDNLGICTKEANMSKTDHTLEEFIELCKKVVAIHSK